MRGLGVFVTAALLWSALGQTPAELPLNTVQLPPGFSISLYTQQPVPDARQLTLSRGISPVNPNAVLVYVGSTDGTVSALVDLDGTGQNVTVLPLLADQDGPNGVVWYGGSLYVAETRRITRYDLVDTYALTGQPLPPGVIIADNFAPEQRGHPLHYINIGPDSKLYVPQGSPSNTGPCQVYQNITQCAINRMNLDGTSQETLVTGVRNSVGFDWDDLGNLWATSNARDDLQPDSENSPDDPLLFIPALTVPNTRNYGYPYCHWQGAGDPVMRAVGPGITVVDDTNSPVGVTDANQFSTFCSDPVNNLPPAQSLGPHVAALGMRFYRGDQFPPEYNNSIFIAEHGSWNRQEPIGYRVAHVTVDPATGATTSHTIFAQGWLQGSQAWGRPVDLLPLPNGSLLVSDDDAGVVYRISYDANAATSVAG